MKLDQQAKLEAKPDKPLRNNSALSNGAKSTSLTLPQASNDSSPGDAKQLIEELRRDKLMGGEVSPGVAGLQAMLARALAKLSADLYSRRSDCLYELIQNADDNKYEPLWLVSLILHLSSFYCRH